MQIEHQFKNSGFFFPTWPIHTLVLGTFNPICGKKTDYFYGRDSNNFWRAIETILGKDRFFYHNNFPEKHKAMLAIKFGCTDIISSIKIYPSVRNKLCGQGYSDQILFTKKYVQPEYEFERIKLFLEKKSVRRIINTWGKRNRPANLINEINNLQLFCKKNKIQFVRDCPSPS